MKRQFPKEWVDIVSERYFKYIAENRPVNYNYFRSPGAYELRYARDGFTEKEIAYYNEILHPPNIAILEHIVDHYEQYEGLQFLDNGCGFGVLSIFLKKIGISCYNYDTLDQIGFLPTFEPVITENVPLDVNVIVSSGMYINNLDYLKLSDLKYLMIDKDWKARSTTFSATGNKIAFINIVPNLIEKFNLKRLEKVRDTVIIYGK